MMLMNYPAGFFSPAAATIAAVLILSSACGDSANNDDGTPSTRPATTSPGSSDDGAKQELTSGERLIRITGDTNDDLLTGSHSLALGDFNDDGEPDLLVGASQADGPDDQRLDGGEAYVLLGPLDGSQELGVGKADVSYFGASSGDNLGYSVIAADINDDGIDDAILGSPGVTAGFDPRTDQGRAYVFFGGAGFADEKEIDLIDEGFDFTVTGAEGFSRLGSAMAAGDVNGDGAGDLVIGAPFAGRPPGSPPGSERTYVGEVYVILGGDDLSGEKNVAILEHDSLLSGAHAQGEFGAGVAVGDIDDDGRDDIIVGAYRSNLGDELRNGSGAVYVFFGREEFPRRLSIADGDEDVTILGRVSSSFGFPLTAGDLNGDGTDDFAAGARLEGSAEMQGHGTVRVFFGGDNLPENIDLEGDSADVTISGQMTSQFLPSDLSVVDLGGDGTEELIIGSLLFNPTLERFGAGAVYVLTIDDTAPAEWSLDDAAALFGEQAGDRFGNAVTGGAIAEGVSGIAALAAGAYPNDPEDDGVVYLVRPALQ
jgi:hypothetical protein